MKYQLRYIACLVCLAFCAASWCLAEEFTWSWEESTEETTDEEEPERQAPVRPTPSDNTITSSSSRTGIDVAAYNRLLEENLELRRKMARKDVEAEEARQAREKLVREVADLEKKLEDSVATIKDLKAEVAEPESKEAEKWRRKLAEEEAGKEALETRLKVLQEKLQAIKKETEKPSRVETPRPTVRVGTDLFGQLERENLLLKKKLAELNAERKKALKKSEQAGEIEEAAERRVRGALQKQKNLKEQIQKSQSREQELKRQTKDLAKKIPELEKQIGRLKDRVDTKDTKLREKERQLAILEEELERREYRLIKAQKMRKLLKQVQEEVENKNQDEKTDMHYNMAVMYMREGRYREAEKEFLQALNVNPNDPDVHYNMGILYDDYLENDKKAAIHYRKYLKLSPRGKDVDSVRQWLMAIEMDK